MQIISFTICRIYLLHFKAFLDIFKTYFYAVLKRMKHQFQQSVNHTDSALNDHEK